MNPSNSHNPEICTPLEGDSTTHHAPSPPTSILQQKRCVQGRDAHQFLGGKSRKLDEVSSQPYIAYSALNQATFYSEAMLLTSS